EISVLDPGGFGAVTITKSISIVSDGAEGGVLATAGSTGIIINTAAGDTVLIRGLVIEGARTGGNGIRFVGQGTLHIQDTVVQGFTGAGVAFLPSAVALPGNVPELYISNSAFIDNAGQGVLIDAAGEADVRAALDGVLINNNQIGLRVDG